MICLLIFANILGKQQEKWPVSLYMANSLDRWVQYMDLVGDRAAFLVTQSLMVTISTNLKMAAGTYTLSKQLNVEALLEQGHQVDMALHSTQNLAAFQQVYQFVESFEGT